jgi:hypothetical protein
MWPTIGKRLDSALDTSKLNGTKTEDEYNQPSKSFVTLPTRFRITTTVIKLRTTQKKF